MGRTSNLRRQHDVAVDLVAEIVAESARIDRPEDAYRVSMQLAKLTGVLRIHFVQEDKTLYPYMMTSANREAAATARTYSDEMGGLAAVFEAYAQRWSSSHAIFADPEGFRRESATIFAALGDRIERENEILYPLAEAIRSDEVYRAA